MDRNKAGERADDISDAAIAGVAGSKEGNKLIKDVIEKLKELT